MLQCQKHKAFSFLPSFLPSVNFGICISDDSLAKAVVNNQERFLSIWQDNRAGDNYDIFGIIMDSNGNALTNSFMITQAPHVQRHPRAAFNPYSDEFVIVWEDQRSYYIMESSDIFEAVVDVDGNIQVAPHIIYHDTGPFKTWNRPFIASADVYPYKLLTVFSVKHDFDGGIKGLCLNSGGIVENEIDIAGKNGNASVSWNGENFFVVYDGTYSGMLNYSIIDQDCAVIANGELTIGSLPYVIYNDVLDLQFIVFQKSTPTGDSSYIYGIFTTKDGAIVNPPGIIAIDERNGYWDMRPFACSKGDEIFVTWDYDEFGLTVPIFPGQNSYYSKVYVDGTVIPLAPERVAEDVTYHAYGSCESMQNGYIVVSEKYVEEMEDTVRVVVNIIEDLAINSIDPASGCANGGFNVTISGTGFKDGASVFFGMAESPEVDVQDCHTIIAKVPEYAEYEIVDVRVVNPTGEEAVLPGAFSYGSLVRIDTISPLSSPLTGGAHVTITGSDFTALSMIRLRAELKNGDIWEAPVTPVYQPPDTLRFYTPAAPEVLVAELCVINPDCGEVCVPEAIGYYDAGTGDLPFSPHVGITSGNTPVTFCGPDKWSASVCAVKFGGQFATKLVKQGEKLIATTPTHPEQDVVVEICRCEPGMVCYPLTTQYEYATFSYVAGSKSYLEVVDTFKDKRVDFMTYVPGDQSQIEFDAPVTSTSFSRKKVIPGRYAYVAMKTPQELKVLKVDTGTSAIDREFTITDPFVYAGDVAVAEYIPAPGINFPEPDYALIVAANHVQIGGYFGGVLILDPDTMTLVQALSIPELSLGQILNVAVDRERVFLSSLTGPISGPQGQLLVTLSYSALTGQWVAECA
ncbi:MAG: hypothetical protein A2Y62_19735, partial [Candidatus Fischerbacteria bacterium RBG_13_37_8]